LVFASTSLRRHGVEQRKVLIYRATKTEILRYEQDREYEDCTGPVLRGDGCLRWEEQCIASAVDASPTCDCNLADVPVSENKTREKGRTHAVQSVGHAYGRPR
jgi:hypothetical protein